MASWAEKRDRPKARWERSQKTVRQMGLLAIVLASSAVFLAQSAPVSPVVAAPPEAPKGQNKVFLPFIVSQPVAPAMRNSDRIGVNYAGGSGQPDIATLASLIPFKNYMDWDNTGRVLPGVNYSPMILAWRTSEVPQSPTDATCDALAASLQNYPAGTVIFMGNEVVKDDGRTPEQYGQDYLLTRACLRGNLRTANKGFLLGNGGMISPYNDQRGLGCVSESDPNSGASFFIREVEEMKRISPTGWQPDIVKHNAYTECLTGQPDVSAFNTVVSEEERLMDQEGLTGQLVIGETTYAGYWNPSSVTDAQKMTFFDGVVDRVVTDKRIRRLFWFLLNLDSNSWWNSFLIWSNTLTLSPLGQHAKDVLQTIDQR